MKVLIRLLKLCFIQWESAKSGAHRALSIASGRGRMEPSDSLWWVPLGGVMFLQVPDGFDHAETHLHAAVGVVLPGLREA